MRYSYCESLLWLMVGRSSLAHLRSVHPSWNHAALRRSSKRRFRELIRELPDIGSLKENSLRISLSGGAAWFAVYESTPEPLGGEQFGAMVDASMRSPLMQKALGSKSPFSVEAQQAAVVTANRDNAASESEFSWNRTVIPGRDGDEYTVLYHRCGLCALGQKVGHPELVPYLCSLDTISLEAMGGVLYRTKTLATGGDVCDFYCCKKGSRWDLERKASSDLASRQSR